MKLPPDIKAKWVAALRSGEYEQGTGTMCTPRTAIGDSVRYCCLGVLQMAVSGRVERDGQRSRDFPSRTWAVEHGLSPTQSVTHWRPKVTIYGAVMALDQINDSGHSFQRIADLIEEQL